MPNLRSPEAGAAVVQDVVVQPAGPETRRVGRIGPPSVAPIVPAVSRRDPVIDFLKGIGCIAVTAHHLTNKAFAETERAWIEAWGIALPGVITFLLVAGYLHGRSARSKPHLGVDYVLARAQRLLPPFFVLTLVYAILYSVVVRLGIYPSASDAAPVWYEKWWTNLTCGPGRVGEQLYFLPVIFSYAAAGTIFFRLTRAKGAWFLGAAAVLCVTAIAYPELYDNYLPGHPPYWSWSQAAMGLAAYFLGFQVVKMSRAALGGLFAVSVGAASVSIFKGGIHAYYLFASTALFAAVLLVRPRLRPLEWVGRASFTVYLYHTPFLIQPLLYLAATQLPRSWHVLTAYAILAFVVLLLSAVHYKLIRSRFKWLTL